MYYYYLYRHKIISKIYKSYPVLNKDADPFTKKNANTLEIQRQRQRQRQRLWGGHYRNMALHPTVRHLCRMASPYRDNNNTFIIIIIIIM